MSSPGGSWDDAVDRITALQADLEWLVAERLKYQTAFMRIYELRRDLEGQVRRLEAEVKRMRARVRYFEKREN